MYPIKLIPVFKDYIWGGTRLKEGFGKKSSLQIIAESWELSCHKDGHSIAANGKFKGNTLIQIIQSLGEGCLGENSKKFDKFPILIKLIDSKQPLSVQVHPDDEYAMKKEGEYGKTEMWYVIDADEGASLVYGFNKNVTPDELRKRINDQTLPEVLNHVPVKKGDCFFIESGLVHAIGKGILIAEIQQNSNTTYRLYDYGRKDASGKQRPLHIEDALNVAQLSISSPAAAAKVSIHSGYKEYQLSECKYFNVKKYEVADSVNLYAGSDSFHAFTALEGGGYILCNNNKYNFNKGDTYFIAANLGRYEVCGNCVFLLTKV